MFGYATTIIPRIYTYYVSTALFAIFGVRMLREGLKMSPDEGQEELEEVQAEIKKKDEEVSKVFTGLVSSNLDKIHNSYYIPSTLQKPCSSTSMTLSAKSYAWSLIALLHLLEMCILSLNDGTHDCVCNTPGYEKLGLANVLISMKNRLYRYHTEKENLVVIM